MKFYAQKFDNVELTELSVSAKEIEEALTLVSEELKQAIEVAYSNIFKFHQQQQTKVEVIETTEGVHCWRKSVGIEKVGLYIPGAVSYTHLDVYKRQKYYL